MLNEVVACGEDNELLEAQMPWSSAVQNRYRCTANVVTE